MDEGTMICTGDIRDVSFKIQRKNVHVRSFQGLDLKPGVAGGTRVQELPGGGQFVTQQEGKFLCSLGGGATETRVVISLFNDAKSIALTFRS